MSGLKILYVNKDRGCAPEGAQPLIDYSGRQYTFEPADRPEGRNHAGSGKKVMSRRTALRAEKKETAVTNLLKELDKRYMR